MKNFKYIIAAGMALMLGSCTKDLDQAPKGALREEALNTPKAAEGLVTKRFERPVAVIFITLEVTNRAQAVAEVFNRAAVIAQVIPNGDDRHLIQCGR